MSSEGLRLYLTEEEAIASLMESKDIPNNQYEKIVEAHKKGIWLGLNEGYNDLPKDKDPREEEESGLADLEKEECMEDITADDIPVSEEAEEADDMMEAIASQGSADGKQESPDGKGVQDKGVGDAISGTNNETASLKGVNSKNTEGGAVGGQGSEPGESGGTDSAKQESPDGKGLQKKSVGKVQC